MLLPIRQIFQEMASEKIRFVLTVLAVAWATLCISGMLAVGEGIRLGVMKTAQNGNGNLIYLTGGIATTDFGRFYMGKPLELKHLSSNSGIVAATSRLKTWKPARYRSPRRITALRPLAKNWSELAQSSPRST